MNNENKSAARYYNYSKKTANRPLYSDKSALDVAQDWDLYVYSYVAGSVVRELEPLGSAENMTYTQALARARMSVREHIDGVWSYMVVAKGSSMNLDRLIEDSANLGVRRRYLHSKERARLRMEVENARKGNLGPVHNEDMDRATEG